MYSSNFTYLMLQVVTWVLLIHNSIQTKTLLYLCCMAAIRYDVLSVRKKIWFLSVQLAG